MQQFRYCIRYHLWVLFRTVDPYSFLADPNSAAFLNGDPDPALQNCGVTVSFVKKNTVHYYLMKSLLRLIPITHHQH